MNYEEARSKIKSGDLLAFSHKSWKTWKDVKSQLVRVFTRSDFSHVATAWVVGDRVMCIEAVIPEVRIYPLSKNGDFFWLPTNAKWTPEAEEAALSYVGNKYSQWAAIKAFFCNIGKRNTQECAALAITIAEATGVDLGDKQTPDAVVTAALRGGSMMRFIENGGGK